MARIAKTQLENIEQKITFSTLIDTFLDHRQLLGLSSKTLTFYKDILGYLNNHGFPQDVTNCTTEDIEKYIARLLRQGMKPVTVNGKIRTLKALFNFANERKYMENNPLKGIKFVKHEKNIIRTFEPKQIQSLIQECLDGTFVGVRDHCLILMMLDTGCRASELLGLRLNDVDLTQGKAVVMGKGRKARTVYFSEDTARTIQRYLLERGQLSHDFLFVSENNNPLKLRSMQDRLRDLGKRAKITDVRVSPHTFRHTFAKMYIQNGGDIFTLQKLLGHTTIDMVRNYVEMFGQDIAKAHFKFSPVKNIMNQ